VSAFEPLADSADLVKHPKFYAFDLGVYNAMLGNFEASADRIGVLAEHLVFNQLLQSAWSKQVDCKLSTYRTRGGAEVDFIVELDREVIALEVKTSDALGESDVRPLLDFRRAYPKAREALVVHLGRRRLKIGSVWCLPWQEALKTLGL
jgi:predicted AAA+ superfamily ATPase